MDRDLLLAKAIDGTLTAEERAQWDVLCTGDPSLRREAEEMAAMARGLHQRIADAERSVDVPTELPPHLFRSLEQGRADAFGPRRSSLLSRQLLPLAAVLILASLAGGAFWLRSILRPDHDLVASTKDATMNPLLPILAPGPDTALTDPTIIWFTLDAAPADVSILDPTGKKTLLQATQVRPPLRWDQLESAVDAGSLAPGANYRLRVRQGETVSERIVRVLPVARPLSAWVAEADDAPSTIRTWLDQDRPGDALILATASAQARPEEGERWITLRSEALKAALARAKEEALKPETP